MASLNYRKEDGEVLKLEFSDQPLTLGRTKEADIQISDDEISRVHCSFQTQRGDFVVTDLGSTNGTFVNDQRIEISKLKRGDRVRIGNTIFEFEIPRTKGATTILRDVEREMAERRSHAAMVRPAGDVGAIGSVDASFNGKLSG